MTTLDALSPVGGAAATSRVARDDPGSADRFLKLLVTQMQNQDPLNPLDNAQVTSQIAQINTVTGIEKVNTSVQGLNSSLGGQFLQLQALQGATLVGRDVVVEGNRLGREADGLASGGFDLGGAADRVTVEVLSGAGVVLGTVELGALGSGRHDFDWAPPAGVDGSLAERFRVVARSGAGTVSTVPLMRDRVESVSTAGGSLSLELRDSGTTPLASIKAFN